MNELQATEAKLKCLRMVEGTELKWGQVIKFMGIPSNASWTLEHPLESYEFALGVVEGKPVWKGDILYRKDSGEPVSMNTAGFLTEFFSWNPPAPKTIMVELPMEDVKFYATLKIEAMLGISYPDGNLVDACKKALESAKCML